MSKNKFIKKLLIAGLCAVTATAMIGATACKDNKPTEEPDDTAHTHQWSETYKSDATGHWKECIAAGHEGDKAGEKSSHGEANAEGNCPTCGYKLTTPDEGGDEEQTKDPVVIDFTADTTADGAIATDLGITTTSAIEIKNQTRKVVYKGEETTLEKGLKMNGAALRGSKSFKVNLPENATIIVYAASGSGSTDTYLSMLDKDGEKVEGSIQQVGFSDKVSDNYAHPAVFSVNANTVYYIGSDGTGSNAVVFRIAVIYGTFTEDKGELIVAQEESCTADGNIAHYKSEYGRYFNESGELIGSEVAIIEACHKFETNVTLTENLPTEENGATYTATCIRSDCAANEGSAYEKTVTLPKLTDRAYTREAGVTDAENNYTYKVTVDGINFTFETEKHEEESLLSLYTIIFNGGDKSISCTSASAYKGYTDWKASGYKTSNLGASTFAGVTYTSGIKLDSKGSLTITINEEANIIVYLCGAVKDGSTSNVTGGIKVDNGEAQAATDAGSNVYKTKEITLAAGEHVLTRGGSAETVILRIDIMPVSAQS